MYGQDTWVQTDPYSSPNYVTKCETGDSGFGNTHICICIFARTREIGDETAIAVAAGGLAPGEIYAVRMVVGFRDGRRKPVIGSRVHKRVPENERGRGTRLRGRSNVGPGHRCTRHN